MLNDYHFIMHWRHLSHIANANMLPQVYAVCRASGYEPPVNLHTV